MEHGYRRHPAREPVSRSANEQHQTRQQRAVRVANLPRAGRFASGNEFVARGDHGRDGQRRSHVDESGTSRTLNFVCGARDGSSRTRSGGESSGARGPDRCSPGGKQERAGAELYMQQHGDTVAGKKIVLEVKDDTGAADVTKRLAEELIGNDHAKVLMGFGLTPLALATAPVATEAKVPEIVSAGATAMITEKSPYIVRTSFTLPQAATPS